MSLKEKEQKIIALEKENQALGERIAELERHLGIDSQTSSKSLVQKLSPLIDQLASDVKSAPVKHLDETGFRISGKTGWLDVRAKAYSTS